MELISVIIPVYNAGLYIERCINSILNQEYENFEIIAINDGSKDDSLDILNRLMAKDQRIKVINKENGGVSSARNVGLANAKGDFLTFVDADDTLCDSALSNMASLMEDNVDFVIASHNEVKIHVNPAIKKNCILKNADFADEFVYFDSMLVFLWAKMLRASIVRDNNLEFDESISFGEDHIFCLQFSKKMKGDAVVTDKVVYNYNYLTGGLCNKYYDDFADLQLCVLKKIVNFFKSPTLFEDKYKDRYAPLYMLGCFDYYIVNTSFKKAVKKINKTLELFSPYISDAAYKEYFSDKEYQYIKNGDYKSFVKCYIIRRPKKTILRKFKHSFKHLSVLIYSKISKK